MISTPQTLIVGGTSVTTGFIAPGYVEVIGNINASNTVTPQPPEIQAINLLSPTLDSRVSYHGPAHTYINVNGNLLTSAVNEWPLEYQNGVAMGRHEPERAATNFQRDSSFTSLSETQEGNDTIWITSQAADVAVNPVEEGSSFAVSVEKPGWDHTGVFSEGTSAFIAADQSTTITSDWTLAARTFANPSVAQIRWYIARVNATNYMYGKTASLAVGNYVASVWRMNTTDNQQSRAAQIEAGSVPTSPIFNDATSQNSRDASTVIVTNPGGATGITIIYSDGTTQSLSFGTSQSVNIPVASQAWGSRYITQITYSTS